MTFSELALIQPILDALEQKSYTHPTPIQQQAIPPILQGKDIFGCAQTGTGKTAAFSLPILQLMDANRPKDNFRKIRTLILAPTRELALQIAENFKHYGAGLNFRQCTVFGGVSQNPQVDQLKKGVDVLIATPGRLLDLMNQGYIKLQAVEFFVLDEADRMLDMGFINDIRKVLTKLPPRRHSLFFSATASPEIMKLANTILNQPVKISVTPVSSTAEKIQQQVYFVQKENKRALLKHVLEQSGIEHALVFTRTKHGADRVARDLVKSGIPAEAIHGDKSQGARERALKGFKARSIRILVATDIASRGIDVDKLTHVINFEIPEQAETYVHRIGRTGRAGESGVALSFCTPDERSYLNDIKKLTKIEIEVVSAHPYN